MSYYRVDVTSHSAPFGRTWQVVVVDVSDSGEETEIGRSRLSSPDRSLIRTTAEAIIKRFETIPEESFSFIINKDSGDDTRG